MSEDAEEGSDEKRPVIEMLKHLKRGSRGKSEEGGEGGLGGGHYWPLGILQLISSQGYY